MQKLVSPTYQFGNWFGETRKIYLSLEKVGNKFIVYANTANLDGSKSHKNIWSELLPDWEIGLSECWEVCLETFNQNYRKV